jgi:hypothetical protein
MKRITRMLLNQLIGIALSVFVVGCNKPETITPTECKYNDGDIVYMTLDSTKCIVKYAIDYYDPCDYYIKYKDDSGRYQEVRVDEFEITQ